VISPGGPGPPLQGARVRSGATVSRSTTTRAAPRERSVPRWRKRCSWERTGSSAAGPERSTGGRTAVRAPGSEPPDQDGSSDQPGRSEEPRASGTAGQSSPAAEACRAGRARGAGTDQPPKRPVKIITQRRAARTRRGRQRAHHHQRSRRQARQSAPHEMPQPALHPVPDYGTTHCATDHKPHSWAHQRRRTTSISAGQMHDDRAAGGPTTPPHRRREILPAGQPGSSGEQREISAERQRLRPTTRRDPCDAGPRGWPARRGCACATETRGFSHGDGCSAGTYACPCSRLSFSRCSVLILRVAAVWTAPSGAVWTAGSRVIPCRYGGTACEQDSPGTRTTSDRGRRRARMPAGGRETPQGYAS